MQPEIKRKKSAFPFLQDGGEMGELTRNYDWSNTSIGTPDEWPQSLRTTLGIVLHSAFPMFLFWEEELICFYNDAFRPSLGANGKHPALGKRGREVWPEIWEFIGPLIEQVRTTGEPVYFENQLVPFYRNGGIENIYWTFSYSPAYGDGGEINGVFVTCTETTKTVNTLQQLEESKQNLAFAIDAAELATWDFDPITNKFTADARYTEWFGLTAEEATDNNLSLNIIAEEDRERVIAALSSALHYSSGRRFDIEYTIRPTNREERRLRAKGKAWFDKTGTAYRLTGTLQDVTKHFATQQELAEKEFQYRTLIEEAPIATAFYIGKEITIKYANDIMIGYWGKDASVIGKTLREAVPELDTQHFPALLEKVFATGEPYTGTNEKADFVVDGKLQSFYFNFTYKPLRNKDGEVYGIHHMAIDVTEKVLAQKQLEESEKSLRNLILKAPVAMCIFRGPEYVVEIVNERMLESWGKTEEEVLNKPVYDALPEARGQGYEDLLYKVYNTGETITAFDAPGTLTRNGITETRYVNLVYDALREGDGTISGIMIVNIDVTKQVLARRTIEESEQQVRALLEGAPFPIGVYVGRELRIRFLNQAIIDVWGKGPDLIGKLYSEVLPEVVEQNILPQLHGVYDTGVPFHARNQRVDLFVDGKLRPFWFNYSFTPLFDAEGKVYGIMNTAADVTDLNLAHKKIEESEQNLRNTILQAPVAMCILKGPNHVIEVANELVIEMWGGVGRDVIGKSIFDAIPEVRGQGFEGLLDQVYNTGETYKAFGVPLNVLRKGSIETVYIDFVYEAYREPEGKISGVIAVAIEVTEQVIARKKIEEAEERARLAVDSAELGTYEINLVTNELFPSRRMIEIFDVNETDGRDRYINAIHPEDLKVRREAYERAFETGQLDYDGRVVRKDGSVNWIRVKGKTYYDKENKPARLIGVVQDITEQKEFEAKLNRLVKERTAELAEINQELKRSNANLEEFAYAASHDMKEPIRKIHVFTDRLKNNLHDKLTGENLRYFERLETGARRMGTLIDDLLLYSHISRGAVVEDTVDLNELINLVLDDMELEIEEKKARISINKLPVIKGHKRQLQQLFHNLVGNALKYNKPGVAPEIDINCTTVDRVNNALQQDTSTETSRFYLITVRDNGIGFEQSNAERIFNVFTRLHGNSEYQGTGVGLSIVRKVVENHHGKIEAESIPGEGSTFKIYLPVL